MICILSVRRLKPGSYDAFRTAVVPDFWPPQVGEITIARNTDSPDEVMSYAYFDGTADELDALRDSPEWMRSEVARLGRIAALEDAVLVNGLYEVADRLPPR